MKNTIKENRGNWSRMNLLLCFSIWLLSSFFCGLSFAAPVDFPQKEITIIVSFGPGGGLDIIARGVGNIMRKYLGVPVVVNNVTGAGGARGRAFVYHSAPDGYTIGVDTPGGICIEVIEKQDYEAKKFSYIGNAQQSPDIFCVRSDSSFRSVKDFKTFGKRLRFGTFNIQSSSTFPPIIMASREAWPMAIVAGYKSGGDTALGLIRGDFEFCCIPLNVAAPFVRSGQIRPILSIDQKRHPNFPNTPSVAEEGHPDLGLFLTNYWFMAPPGVPKARIKILEDALMKTLKDPEFIKWAEGANVDIAPMTGEQTAQMVLKLFALTEGYKKEIIKFIESK